MSLRFESEIDPTTVRRSRSTWEFNKTYLLDPLVFATGKDGITRYMYYDRGVFMLLLYRRLSNQEKPRMMQGMMETPVDRVADLLNDMREAFPENQQRINLVIGPDVVWDENLKRLREYPKGVGVWERLVRKGDRVEISDEEVREMEQQAMNEYDVGGGRIVVDVFSRGGIRNAETGVDEKFDKDVTRAVDLLKGIERNLGEKLLSDSFHFNRANLLAISFKAGEFGERWRSAELERCFIEGTTSEQIVIPSLGNRTPLIMRVVYGVEEILDLEKQQKMYKAINGE